MDEASSVHRYPAAVMLGDYFRSGMGLFFTVVPLAVTTPLPAVTGVLTGLAALFLAYGGRTVIRHCTVIRLSAKGMETRGPLGTHIAWEDVRGLSLRYFSTRRDRTGGWMQLKVKGERGAVRIDSTIDDFDVILHRTARAARALAVKLDSSTVENLRLRGVRLVVDEREANAP